MKQYECTGQLSQCRMSISLCNVYRLYLSLHVTAGAMPHFSSCKATKLLSLTVEYNCFYYDLKFNQITLVLYNLGKPWVAVAKIVPRCLYICRILLPRFAAAATRRLSSAQSSQSAYVM